MTRTTFLTILHLAQERLLQISSGSDDKSMETHYALVAGTGHDLVELRAKLDSLVADLEKPRLVSDTSPTHCILHILPDPWDGAVRLGNPRRL